MRARYIVCLAAVLLGACAAAPPPAPPPPPPPPPTADEVFLDLGARYLRELPEQSPVGATALGDHRFDTRLDDVSGAAWNARAEFAERYLAAVRAIDRAALSRANQVDALLLAHELERDLWRLRTLADWRWNPLVYTKIAGDSLYGLIAREFAPLPERLQSLGARLGELPRFLAQVREALDPARVPRIHADTAARQNQGLIALLDGTIADMIGTLPEGDQPALRAAST